MHLPYDFFVKYLVLCGETDAAILLKLGQWGFLSPDATYLGLFRAEMEPPPANFDPLDRAHRPSTTYLRDQQVYELFFPNSAVEEAWGILADPTKRMAVEQVLLSRLDTKVAAQKMNRRNNWFLTAAGIETFGHFFWHVKLLTFDEWGRFLYGRSSLYARYMGLLQGTKELAFFHLRVDQVIESKQMIRRAQEIAYFTLEEVAQQPGCGPDKVKAINMLTKSITDCHEAQSTSDMALKEVLKQFERFRMEHPQIQPKPIGQLAPKGNFTNSGVKDADVLVEPEKVNA